MSTNVATTDATYNPKHYSNNQAAQKLNLKHYRETP